MPASYAYLGPEGTFTEAALRTLPEAATRELIPMVSVPAALDAVRSGEAEAAFVPIENSVEGGITTTLDELVAGAPLMIYREVLLSITFALLVTAGHQARRTSRRSPAHPAAQPQVRNWLTANLPGRPVGVGRLERGRRPAGPGGPLRRRLRRRVRGRHGTAWSRWRPSIHDAENAQTRFVLVGRPGPARRADRRGQDVRRALAARRPPRRAAATCCGEFAARGVNLMRIAVPARRARASATTASAIDAEGHISDRRVAEALMGLKRICREVRFLGSYPRADVDAADVRAAAPGTSDEEFVAAADWLARCQDGRA